MKRAVEMLIFLELLLLAFWLMNIYKHIRSGSWSRGEKIMDTVGTILLLGMLIGAVIPMFR